MANLFDLSGKTALVTGAKRGIGMGMAVGLAQAGADIVGVSASQEPAGSDVQRAVEAEGRRFIGRACDLSDRSAVSALAAWLTGEGPQIDIFVSNAGTTNRSPALDHTDADWDRVHEVNLNTPFMLARALAGPMLERGHGKVIFVTSVLSFQGGIGIPAYVSSKTGLVGVMRALANEWADGGVNVNAIAPGYIATDMTAALEGQPDRMRSINERIPAGRWGRPEDLAGATVFLSSAASDYVHGTVLSVDGGWLSR